MSAFQDMIDRTAQAGRLDAVWLRTERRATPGAVQDAWITNTGLEGDHGRAGKRAVTLVQAEHLPVIGAMLGQGAVAADILRRNLVVSGVNLRVVTLRCAGMAGGARRWWQQARLLSATRCAFCRVWHLNRLTIRRKALFLRAAIRG